MIPAVLNLKNSENCMGLSDLAQWLNSLNLKSEILRIHLANIQQSR